MAHFPTRRARVFGPGTLLAAATLLVVSALPLPAQQGLVGCWPLDEGRGTTIDDLSGLSRPGTISAGCRWTETDRGTALAFAPASGSSAAIPSCPAWDYAPGQVGDLTLALWLHAAASGDGFVLSHYFSGTPGAWGLFFEGGQLKFSTYFDRENWTGERKSATVQFRDFGLGRWHFAVLVWQRGKQGWLKAYLDGEEVDTAADVPVTAALQEVTHLGSRDGRDRGFAGMLRGLCVFNRALAAAEVRTLFETGPQLPSPVLVSDLTTDKLLYYSRETVTVRFRVRNASAVARTLRVVAESVRDLDDRTARLDEPVTLPAGGGKAYALTMPARDFRMGSAVTVTLREGDNVLSRKEAVFQVGDQLGEVAIGASSSAWSQTGLAGKRDEILKVPEEARARGVNTLELFFWSPCDWALHVPRTERWWSGQASYPQDARILKEFIDRAHTHGIRVMMYASCHPAGPFGWEAAYRHPEWFLDGNGLLPTLAPAEVEALDKWNNPEWRQAHPGNPGWLRVPVDLRTPQALDHGIGALIDGARHFDWDGVRFDGHYTIHGFDEISTHNLRRLKERVAAERPGFELGYNYGRAPEWRSGWTHEMREAMAGGGIYLQEGIRAWWKDSAKYASWRDYATNELRIAKRLQALGGFYSCMWESERLPPEQAFYKVVYGLIAGGHPALFTGERVPYCRDWGAFLTRWSRFLWDRSLRAASAEGLAVTPAESLFWRPLVQELVASAGCRFLVVHLVNPPPEDAIAETRLPPAAGDVSVTYRLAAGESLARAMLVSPQHDPFARTLPAETDGGTVRFTIADAPLWSMVVLELQGAFTPPAAVPAFTEAPDATAVEKARQSALASRIVDPNKDAEAVDDDPSVRIWETDRGMSGLGALPGSDPDAGNGRCQVNDAANVRLGHGKKFMGYTNLGPLRPGRYRLTYRMKWTAGADGAGWDVFFYINDIAIDTDVVRAPFLSPRDPGSGQDDPASGQRLSPPGAYRDYSFEFAKAAPGYINACAIVDAPVASDQKIYMDCIRTEMLDPIPDRELAALATSTAPAAADTIDAVLSEARAAGEEAGAPARTPNGTAPARFLLVRGLLADLYRVGEVVKPDTVYELPGEAGTLFEYDCVILANVDVTFSSLAQRRLLKEFVEAGGCLVVLGGIATLGNGGMTHTFLDDLLPVVITGRREVRKYDKPALLGETKDTPFADSPALFWRHSLAPKADAQPVAYADGEPIAFGATRGQGRALVFLGTTLGPGESLETPFWETESWRRLLARMLTATGQ